MLDEKDISINEKGLTGTQLALERVIAKTFSHYSINLEITPAIRTMFKCKLWRMGKSWSELGSKNRSKKLVAWKNEDWEFSISHVESKRQLLAGKRKAEIMLDKEIVKRQKLEKEVAILTNTNKQQADIIKSKKSYSSAKKWNDCSRQQQYNRKRQLGDTIKTALSFCEAKGFEPKLVEIQNKDTKKTEIFDICNGTFLGKETAVSSKVVKDKVHSALFVKDKYSISDQAFHEISMITPGLPSCSTVKKLALSMNSEFEISPCPNEIIGVQQSLRVRIAYRIKSLLEKTKENADLPNTIRIKLTGDGTRIARGLNVVNVAFTILEEGTKARSVAGNHTIAIMKVSESYDELIKGLRDICQEARDLEMITVDERIFKITFFLGGDWKFLATVNGLEHANANFACIWCKCAKTQRFDMHLKWSISDVQKGARTIEEISQKAKLPKSSPDKYGCCREPIFPFIPIDRVIIDTLHLFLRVSDLLLNLLIRDLQILDGIKKGTSKLPDKTKHKNMKAYEEFLNGPCKIRFKWYLDDSNKFAYRDLTGPEKHRVFNKINIPSLFPDLKEKIKLQNVWSTFYELINKLTDADSSDAVTFESSVKSWVEEFLTIYQTKDVTPYMHAFAMHVPQFLSLHGNITIFTQQGLEKLNDVTTKYFQRSSNHHEMGSLKQILEKHNRLEALEDGGHQRTKQIRKCSVCNCVGHNKRSCKQVA